MFYHWDTGVAIVDAFFLCVSFFDESGFVILWNVVVSWFDFEKPPTFNGNTIWWKGNQFLGFVCHQGLTRQHTTTLVDMREVRMAQQVIRASSPDARFSRSSS